MNAFIHRLLRWCGFVKGPHFQQLELSLRTVKKKRQ